MNQKGTLLKTNYIFTSTPSEFKYCKFKKVKPEFKKNSFIVSRRLGKCELLQVEFYMNQMEFQVLKKGIQKSI